MKTVDDKATAVLLAIEENVNALLKLQIAIDSMTSLVVVQKKIRLLGEVIRERS